MSVYLEDGRVVLKLKYPSAAASENLVLDFRTTGSDYADGSWFKVEAARAVRSGTETGVLRLSRPNGVNEDLMDTIGLPPGVAFNLASCVLYFGGVTPTFHHDTQYRSVRTQTTA